MSTEFVTVTAYLEEGLFYILLLSFTIHAVVLSYHWFSYGASKKVNTLSLAVYLIGGAVFFGILAFLLLQL